MFIEEIKEPKESLGDKFESFGKDLGRLCDKAFSILEDKQMGKDERAEFIDVVAAIKGAKMASYKMMEKYSKISSVERKEIDEKADSFVDGLNIKTK